MPKVTKELQPKRQKKPNGYVFPEKLPVGELLKDTFKKEWIIGPSIGKGGFGEIYSANRYGEESGTFPYAIKIEPHENGPLFMEKNLYIKIAKSEEVAAWKESNKIKTLGMPTFHGSGSHIYKGQKYRFMVMEKYGQDLWSLFQNNQKKFPPPTVYKCALQIIDVLNYIHDKDYIHGDIKGANILLGVKKGTENNIFLVDFGIACKYVTKEFKKDPKQAHNGTIEYTSCDWHQGVPTRRGDFEILGYNLLHWLNSTLPWEKDIKNKEKVYEKKNAFMDNVPDYMEKHFPGVPKVMCEFFKYISKLKFNECPNYNYCKDLFIKELKKLKIPLNSKLEFVLSRKHNLKEELNTDSEDDIPVKKSKVDSIRKKKGTISSSNKQIRNKNTPPPLALKNSHSPSLFSTPQNTTLQSDEDMFYTPEEIQNIKSPKKQTTPKLKVTRRNVNKINTTNKPSWKDAPTVRAGNENNVAGQYTKKTLSRKKLNT